MKTNFYHCKPIGEYWVAITGEPCTKKGEWFLNNTSKSVLLNDMGYDLSKNYPNEEKIIAISSGHNQQQAKSNGLLTFEVKSKAEELAIKDTNEHYEHLTPNHDELDKQVYKDFVGTFIRGYKAAKGFSEEDMCAAIKYGFECHRDVQHDNIDIPLGNKLQWIQHRKSLLPQIQVWQNEICSNCKGGNGYHHPACEGYGYSIIQQPRSLSSSLIDDKGEKVTLYI